MHSSGSSRFECCSIIFSKSVAVFDCAIVSHYHYLFVRLGAHRSVVVVQCLRGCLPFFILISLSLITITARFEVNGALHSNFYICFTTSRSVFNKTGHVNLAALEPGSLDYSSIEEKEEEEVNETNFFSLIAYFKRSKMLSRHSRLFGGIR